MKPRSSVRWKRFSGPVSRLSQREQSIGVSVSETTEEITIAAVSVTANSRNSRPTTPPISKIGMKTATSEAVMETIVKPICFAPASAASMGEEPLLEVACDVLGHDDGVVHDEARGDRQRHQRQVVDAVVEQVHGRERPHEGERTAMLGDRRRTQVPEEQKYHQNHEQNADQKRALDLLHRRANRLRAVDGDVHADGGRDGGGKGRKEGADAIARLDDVGAGLPADDEQHRAGAVGPGRDAVVLYVVEHLRHVDQPDGRVRLAADDQGTEAVGAEALVVGAQDVHHVRAAERALRRVRRAVGERRAHVLEPDADAREPLGVDLNAHGRLLPATHEHLAHARNARQLLCEHRVRRVEQLRERLRRRAQRNDHDRRVGRVDLAIRRARRQIGRQLTARGRDRRLHVARGRFDAAIERKLQRDVGCSRASSSR